MKTQTSPIKIVPFGKYKGKPVDVLHQDREYCEWLSDQDWFRIRFPAIHTLIINNFGEPDETPEHNALQALFTDNEWCVRFALIVLGGASEIQAHIRAHNGRCNACKSGPFNGIRIRRCQFEESGIDVYLSVCEDGEDCDAIAEEHYYNHCSSYKYKADLLIECKPSLGDNYPATLRQIKSFSEWVGIKVLLIGEGGYTGIGATFEQVQTMFRTAGIKIVTLADVERLSGGLSSLADQRSQEPK